MQMPGWPKSNMAMIMAAKARICVQERPEAVPTGELPQNMTLIVDRHLVGKISPGTRVSAIGIYSIYQVHLCYPPPVLQRLPPSMRQQQALPVMLRDLLRYVNTRHNTCHMLQQAALSFVHD